MSFNSEWENIAVVGRGGSSTVYKAVLRPSGKFVAVKQIDIDGLSRDQIGGIKGEIETMKDLSHPNILCYLGTQQSPNRVFIFLEYADRGSLRQFYQSSGPLTEPQISFCLQGIVAGLNYLHDNGIAHRDIKCANCLLCSDGVVKLADFGASKRFEMDSIVSGLKGTPHWMAPEVIKGTQMTTGWIKADVWSLGCAVVEMFTAKVPYAEYENPMTAMYKIASGEIPSLKPSSVQPDAPSAALVSFIHACCAVDPTVRPGADALLSHAFIVEKVNDVGALFAEAAPIQTPALTGAAGQPTESEANVGCSTSAATAAQHHHRISPVEVPAEPVGGSRSRAGSMCSLVSGGGDDDETTVAHGAETSYTDDDFCSYGSTGQSDLNAQPLGLACNSWDKYASGAATPIAAVGPGIAIATGESQEPLIKDEGRTGRALAGGPPSGVRTSSRSRSRGHSRPMAINTAPAPSMSVGVGDLLDASTGGMEDLLTPALHKEAGRGASVQVQMMPMLGEQVRELTLSTLSERASSSTKGPYLVRKWSETAFLNASQDMCVEVKPDNNDFKNGETMPVCELTKDKVSAAGSVTHNSAPPSGVPTYEDANMVYKNMMMKYSPRAKDTGIIQKFKVADLDAQADVAASGADEIEDSVSDTDSLGSKVNDKSTSVVVSTVSAPPVDELPVNVLPLSLKHPSPAPVLEVVAAPDRAAPINDSSHSVPASNRQKLREPSQKVEPLKELKPIVREVKRQKPKDLRNPVIASGVSGDTITDRPYAPLSGDKLRIHSFYEPKKVMCDSGGAAASTGPVSSAEALDRLSNSGAAAVRKIAAQELREVHDKRTLHGTHSTHSDSVQRVRGQAKGKGGVPHYTAKALKRAHHQISPRPTHLSSQTQQQGAHHHHHLAYSQVHNNQLAVSERVVVGPVGGVRSQSAGVNLSCEGGGNAHSNRKDARQKLPPVLRGMLRGGASSSSGNIGSIDEGHALPAGADSGCDHAVGAVPMMLLDPSASPVSRYIQSAPAVSRSLNLPPIEGTHRHGLGQVHRQGGSIDNFTSSNSSGSGGQEDGGGGAMLTSHTPTAKQPRQHRFGRPTVPSGVSEILQQSFANAMKGYSHDQKGAHE